MTCNYKQPQQMKCATYNYQKPQQGKTSIVVQQFFLLHNDRGYNNGKFNPQQ
jgi:hypothetical protein